MSVAGRTPVANQVFSQRALRRLFAGYVVYAVGWIPLRTGFVLHNPGRIWVGCGARRRLQQIFEVDPLACPTCHGPMRIVAFITRRR